MKRTRAATKAKHAENNKTDVAKNEPETKTKDSVQDKIIRHKNVENKKIKTLKAVDNRDKVTDFEQPLIKNVEPLEQKKKSKLNLQTLRDNSTENKKNKEEYKPNVSPPKNKSRAVVDLEIMKEELKQLEDPPTTPWEKEISSAKLEYSFFDSPCEQLAQNLLGKVLVRCLENGTILKGRIVETEAYLGTIDKASMTYQNRVTPRTVPMYMSPGTVFVYMTYGMYHCFNISSQGVGCAVLIRAVDPIEGLKYMASQRNSKRKSKKGSEDFKIHELCNGPSKLCMAYQLDRTHNKYSVCSWKGMWIENDNSKDEIKIVKSSRIGIDRSGPEWAKKPLRYYICGNRSVSKRDAKAEEEML